MRGRSAQGASPEPRRAEPAPASRARVEKPPRSREPLPPRSKAAAEPPKRSRRRRRGGAYAAPDQLTSVPTSRNAYIETRVWLLDQHGPVCAYCAREFPERVMTLDHVTPRRGLTAYDRRDNLVLACQACNSAKRDLAPLAFLLASRVRAANLLRFGAHLSPMLLDLARSLAPDGAAATGPVRASDDLGGWGMLDEGESPYAD